MDTPSHAPVLRNDARAAATYHRSMMVRAPMKPGFRYLAIAQYLTSTTVFADGGIVQVGVGL